MLGVGLLYQPAWRDLVLDGTLPVDYLEVIPDTLWRDRGPGGPARFVSEPADRRYLEQVRDRMPVLFHGIGLSIGSAGPLDEGYVDELAAWVAWLDPPWLSEHLAYCAVEEDGEPVNLGLTLPLTLDEESVDRVGRRVRALAERLGRPFLLENNVYYFATPAQPLSEPQVLNAISARFGGGVLLDLHNLWVNVRNGVMDAPAYLAELDLSTVREVHVAGGMERDGFYLDAHSGAPPAEVWALLDEVVAACPELGGVTFELLGSWGEQVGTAGIAAVLERARDVLGARR